MSVPSGRARIRAERRGRHGELWAAWWLRLHGWTILARRRRLPMIEVDLIARRGDVVAIVEVKYRPTADRGLSAVDPRAAARLHRAAAQVAAELGAAGRPASVRVDMIAVAPWRLPVHVERIIG